MRFTGYSFGSIRVDGVTYDHDLIIDRGRSASARRPRRGSSAASTGTPHCRSRRTSRGDAAQLVVGSGADGALPVMQQVRDEARRRKVELVVLPTAEAIGTLAKARADTNAILHLTC
jgi:hypothetical protein